VLKELAQDRARLDWLESYTSIETMHYKDGSWEVCEGSSDRPTEEMMFGTGDTLRQAIDKAKETAHGKISNKGP